MTNRTRDDIDLDLFELLADTDKLSDSAEIPVLLAKLLNVYGLKSVAYLGAGLTDRPGEGPYLAVTYSPEWVEHYKTERFVDVDPAIQVGLRRMLPIDWSELATGRTTRSQSVWRGLRIRSRLPRHLHARPRSTWRQWPAVDHK